MPVTLQEFKLYTNIDEVLLIFMKDKYKETLREREKTKKHKKFEKCIEKFMYGTFYTSPISRLKWPLLFLHLSEKCPKEMKCLVFDIPEKYRDDTFLSW